MPIREITSFWRLYLLVKTGQQPLLAPEKEVERRFLPLSGALELKNYQTLVII